MKRIKNAYYKPVAGEWIQPVSRSYRLACCDCGLVHKMDFAAAPKKRGLAPVKFRVFSAPQSTAAIRRKPHRFMPAK